MHAMARLLLHGRIANIQCSWVKLGDEGTVAMLHGGCNDLGGTLMEETISRMAGSEHGSARTVAQLRAIAAAAGRPARPRRTDRGTTRATAASARVADSAYDRTRLAGVRVTFRRLVGDDTAPGTVTMRAVSRAPSRGKRAYLSGSA